MTGVAAFLIAAAAAMAATSEGGRADELFAEANGHYERGEYDEAADSYERILEYGVENEVVYYNLGNARFKAGRLGEAILSYERALRLDPGDRLAADNLSYAEGLTVDRVERPEASFPRRAVTWVLHRTTPVEDAWLLLVAVFLLGGVGAVAILVPPRGSRRPQAYLAAVLVIMTLWSGAALGYKEWSAATSRRGVVLVETVDVLSGPSPDNTSLFTVHEGLRVRIRNRREGWVQILLPNGLNGWVPSATLGIV